jgi:hypothetical protein
MPRSHHEIALDALATETVAEDMTATAKTAADPANAKNLSCA